MDAAVVITSNHFPPITLDNSGPASEPNPFVRWLLGWLQPRAVVKVWGEEVGTLTPAGKPGPSDWPLYGFIVGGLVLLGAWIFLRGLVSFVKR
jgi:hypothetical protein